ncbi:MAG: ribonuclease R [Clostridia bacterium]|nr:ribonuclease R [Clostridia bacterium]
MIEELEKKDTLVGTFQNNRSFGFVVPDNKKLYGDIFISKKNFGKARNNHKVLVKIIKQAKNDQKAEGKIIEVLGGANEAGVDMLSLIKEYNLPAEFPKPVVLEAKSKPKKVQEKEFKYRKDLRNDIVFTIDGEDAKDLDDAVCVTKKENGNYVLDVHIADVSQYVGEGSELDKEALIRGTSIYMLGRVIPMLPRELSNGICSLNEGEDRLTLSCTMEIDKQGKVVDSDIYKAVIKVTKRMSYHDVQAILDNSDKETIEKYKEYIPNFKLMEELALILKERRKEQGYLNLDIPESKIDLDIDGKVTNIGKYETTFANEIIEQFMLIANETIAEKFYWLQAPFIYRVHEEPDLDKIRELNGFLYNFGLRIKVVNEKVYPNEFAKALEKVRGTEEEKVVANLILRTLKVARYEAQNKGHFGIASKYYCHFTSPIRRYPDLFIHRIISKYLKENYNVKENFIDEYRERAENRASQSSEREKIATKVERESEKIKKAEFMQDKIGEVYEGIISSVTNFGLFVELENTVEGLVKFENISDEYFIFDESRRMLIGEKSRKTYKIGDKVTVRVISASKALRQVDFEIVPKGTGDFDSEKDDDL